jgi:hypothetical protein
MTSQIRKIGVAIAVIGAVLIASTTAQAGNCLKVKPHVKNNSGKEITVKNLIYKRNGLTYVEGLTNVKVEPSETAQYNGQRLNHLNSGNRAYFGVEFKARRDSDNNWVHMSMLKPNDEKCWDRKTVNIKVSEADIAAARQ